MAAYNWPIMPPQATTAPKKVSTGYCSSNWMVGSYIIGILMVYQYSYDMSENFLLYFDTSMTKIPSVVYHPALQYNYVIVLKLFSNFTKLILPIVLI